MPEHFDVLIIGAGISGIGAAYHLQTHCPGKRYAILERRANLGGTWDLFRYPGVRSDSDMYTLGYGFRPWTGGKAIADGASILDYLRDTARENGIDKHIRYGCGVEAARWCSETARWTLSVRNMNESESGSDPEPGPEAEPELREISCSFLVVCAGYYNYERGHTPTFPDAERFAGPIVHPQHWPPDLDYAGRRVVVIGSGATAVTLLPALAESAAHVTMLQRSPSYVLATPAEDPVMRWLGERLPPLRAYQLTRAKNIALSQAIYWFCRAAPKRARKLLLDQARARLGEGYDVETHFNPDYEPWDQRLCLAPGGDLFEVIKSGRASVVTDHIERFTETGLTLRSGATLDADIIVTATGLELRFLGGITLEVDGVPVALNETLAYRGLMCSGVPNMALCIGYTNASWTLKVDLSCEYICRLLNYMDEQGFAYCAPKHDEAKVGEAPLLDFDAGYVRRSAHLFPRQGTEAPWHVYQNYVRDRLTMRRVSIADPALRFVR